ncbi:MAG: class I SAM-dependent methyltransferase [Alphaproteobacteria bacterium]|nr:class I SAM-dependent methyltransferase [Alphaproteobacteria bacterium]
MQEYDIGYFDPSVTRRIARGSRTIRNKLIAWEQGREFYDGARENGYGGYRYDGRWQRLLPAIIRRYGLTARSAVLDVGCKKGFFLHDLGALLPGIKVAGIETSSYPIDEGMPSVRTHMSVGRFDELPFADGSFDFVLAFSSIYILNLRGVVDALREIQRVSLGRSYVTLGAYRNDVERAQFEAWSLLGTTVLHVDDWMEVFAYAGYTGDYYFTTAGSLNLRWAD